MSLRHYFNKPLLSVFIFITAVLFFFSNTAHSAKHYKKDNSPLVTYDTGYKKNRARNYLSGDNCTHKPCIISKYGAIHLSDKARQKHIVQLGLFHDGSYRSIALFEEGSNIDEKFTERFFNKRQNRKIFDLENVIQNSFTDTLYIYGIRLHYPLDEGDVVIIQLTDKKNPFIKTSYYFRYHRKGPIWDADVAIISPLRLFFYQTQTVSYATPLFQLPFQLR